MKRPKFLRERLAKARKRKGWSYTDLVLELYKKRGLRLAYNTLANWEAGRSEPRVGQLIVIAETLKVSLGYFFDQEHNLSSEALSGRGKHGNRNASP